MQEVAWCSQWTTGTIKGGRIHRVVSLGFRSTFRDWASEQTSFPHETCEHALAHRISDKAEAAYRRGDQFEKRRMLMEAWAGFCKPLAAGNVVMFQTP